MFASGKLRHQIDIQRKLIHRMLNERAVMARELQNLEAAVRRAHEATKAKKVHQALGCCEVGE